MDSGEKFVAAVIGTVIILFFAGLFGTVTVTNGQDDQLAKQCISRGMQWNDQTSNCTR